MVCPYLFYVYFFFIIWFFWVGWLFYYNFFTIINLIHLSNLLGAYIDGFRFIFMLHNIYFIIIFILFHRSIGCHYINYNQVLFSHSIIHINLLFLRIFLNSICDKLHIYILGYLRNDFFLTFSAEKCVLHYVLLII